MNDKSRQSESKQPWPMLLMNAALGVLGFVAILTGLFNLIAGDATLAVAGVGCGVVLILIATVHRFEVIKGIGIEAKTRDLRREIDNADEILKQIKEIAVGVTPALLSVAAGTGRFDSVQPAELVYRLARLSDRVLTSAGEGRAAVRAALDPWSQRAAMDVTRDIAKLLKDDARRVQKELRAILDSWAKPIQAGDAGHQQVVDQMRELSPWLDLGKQAHEWSPERCAIELRKVADNLPAFFDDAVAAEFRRQVDCWAPEMEHLAEHHDFKDPSIWLKRLGSIHEH